MNSEDSKHQAYLQSLKGALLPQLQASIAGASSLTSERYRKAQEHEQAIIARREREAAVDQKKTAFSEEKAALEAKLVKQKDKNKKKKKKNGSKRARSEESVCGSSVE